MVLLFCCVLSVPAEVPASLEGAVKEVLNAKKAKVGVGVLDPAGNVVVINPDWYPMMSVFKFHIALKVLDMVDRGELTLDGPVKLTKEDLESETHSVLRKKYPGGGVDVPLAEIINDTVTHSDNCGCDVLLKLAGGPEKVESFIKGKGIADVSIASTEMQMQDSVDFLRKNKTTPVAMVRLLKEFYEGRVVSPESREFLLKAMLNTSTGNNRIRALLPVSAIVADKTGMGPRINGAREACNDVGIVILPDGRYMAIAVFVSQSEEDDEANERIIADVAKLVWDYYVPAS